MNNLIFNNDQERNVPIANHHNDFRGFLQHFKNMFDFGRHNDLINMEPKIEVAENKNNVTVMAEIPGVAEEDLKVEVSNNGHLTISGEKQHKTENNKNGNYFSEISYGMVQRSIYLPQGLDLNKISADYTDGVLKISIPKIATKQVEQKKVNIARKKTKKSPTVKKAKKTN